MRAAARHRRPSNLNWHSTRTEPIHGPVRLYFENQLLQSLIKRMAFAISRSIIVSGTDLFASLLKLSLFFSLLRMFSATMLDAVPMDVAIPPIRSPQPTPRLTVQLRLLKCLTLLRSRG